MPAAKKPTGRPKGTLADADAKQIQRARASLQESEIAADRALRAHRQALATAIRDALAAGASTRAIAQATGLSHQRIHQLARPS
jgi:hypothetical protein